MKTTTIITRTLEPKGKILFANMPMDGHFNPLTGIAMHLKTEGYDVRWYSGKMHRNKIRSMNIPVYPFNKALEINHENLEETFPDRKNHKTQLSKLKHDINNYFILRGPEFYEDIKDIYEDFEFDMMICDVCFTGAPFVKDLMKLPVVAIGVVPLVESSRDLPPAGMGLAPSEGFAGKVRDSLLRFVSKNIVFKESGQLMNSIFHAYGMPAFKGIVFDALVQKVDLLLQIGVPSFEFRRSDMSKHVRFVGPLLPYSNSKPKPFAFRDMLNQYRKVILVTQGTVERDIEKLLVPTLEAFKDTDCCVVATTGGHRTQELKSRFPQENLIIEDYIDFREIMPLSDVYITNGGYGGVNLGIKYRLPMVVAGVHEGKNDINARIGYFKLGVNLQTETPSPAQIKQAVAAVFNNPVYSEKVAEMSGEFMRYDTNKLCEYYISKLLKKHAQAIKVEAIN